MAAFTMVLSNSRFALTTRNCTVSGWASIETILLWTAHGIGSWRSVTHQELICDNTRRYPDGPTHRTPSCQGPKVTANPPLPLDGRLRRPHGEAVKR